MISRRRRSADREAANARHQEQERLEQEYAAKATDEEKDAWMKTNEKGS